PLAVLDGGDDLSLADRMAVANLRVVRYGGKLGGVGFLKKRIACRRRQQQVEHRPGERLATLEERLQLAAPVRSAQEDGPGQAAVLDDQLLVNACRGVKMADDLALGRPLNVA